MNDTSFAKRYGQVFLKNPNIAKFEVSLLGLQKDSTILEIGPGKGVLTRFLIERGYSVTCVESDHRFYDYLEQTFSQYILSGRLYLEKTDFLKFNPRKFDGIIGNIPYHISSSIIFKLQEFSFQIAVLMVQKEFAERLIAVPGNTNYSRLSVNAQLRYAIDIAKKVSKENFSPKPEVDSSIITLKSRNAIEYSVLQKVDPLLKIVFSQKRKKLGSVLKNIPGEYKDKRPGELSPEDYVKITSNL
jgi:16S rRNA (adenine1518-N6/adenine1519-N6)-dimethyltransferase